MALHILLFLEFGHSPSMFRPLDAAPRLLTASNVTHCYLTTIHQPKKKNLLAISCPHFSDVTPSRPKFSKNLSMPQKCTFHRLSAAPVLFPTVPSGSGSYPSAYPDRPAAGWRGVSSGTHILEHAEVQAEQVSFFFPSTERRAIATDLGNIFHCLGGRGYQCQFTGDSKAVVRAGRAVSCHLASGH